MVSRLTLAACRATVSILTILASLCVAPGGIVAVQAIAGVMGADYGSADVAPNGRIRDLIWLLKHTGFASSTAFRKHWDDPSVA